MDINALMKALPVYGLEPQKLANIKGFPKPSRYSFPDNSIDFLEPPAGQHEPFVLPIDLMERLFILQGEEPGLAHEKAVLKYAELRPGLTCYKRPVLFDSFDSETEEYVPVYILLKFLREKSLAQERAIQFLENAVEATKEIPVFCGLEIHKHRFKLLDLPEIPSPEAMIEFVAYPPWLDCIDDGGLDSDTNLFLSWRDAMRPIASSLERRLGEAVCYFKEWGDELDDDYVHRFLVLHWCCSYKPESAYVRYLLEVSGAHDVEELKAALIDPHNYMHPFKMNYAFMGAEAWPCHFSFSPTGETKTVGIVFATEKARITAEYISLQQIGIRIILAAPENLLYDTSATAYLTRPGLLHHSMRFAQPCGGSFLRDGVISDPITFLAHIDELFVVADEEIGQGFDLKLSDSIEELLWLALEFKIPAHYYPYEITPLGNYEGCLEKRGVPARVSAKRQRREEYTRSLKVIKVDCDWSSSGLWTQNGENISYDLLSLPLPLIRRIIAWHADYDGILDEVMANTGPSEHWWAEHEKEQIEIAKELQEELGPTVSVKVGYDKNAKTITEILSQASKVEPDKP